MRALTWQGKRSVAVQDVPDPRIVEPTDAVVRITSTAICGSDLHLYEVLAPYLAEGDVLGHEPMGIVEEVGSAVTNLAPGDRVVIPFTISCGHCWMCERGLTTQCETTQVREKGSGAALFGYTSLYGSVPGGQAELLRVPHADFNPIKVGREGDGGAPDERYLFLSDILPTAWQGCSTPTSPRAGPSRSWAWDRWGSSPPASAASAGTRSSRWTPCPSGGRWRSATASPRST